MATVSREQIGQKVGFNVNPVINRALDQVKFKA